MNQQSAQTPQFKMTAPTQEDKKRDDIQLLPAGPNPGVLYSIVDLGTHHNDRFNKDDRLVRLTFEFPLFKQLFRTDDTEKRPTVVSVEYSFIMAEKSNLKKFCDGALGRILRPDEYKDGYDIGQFLGRPMIVNIIHVPSKKDPNVSYARITTVQGITDQVREMYNIDWNLVQRFNDLSAFLIDAPNFTCFQSNAFANLPNWLREKIMSSVEAKAYANAGGAFIEKAEKQEKSPLPPNAKPPVQRQPVSELVPIVVDGKELVMKCQWSYEELVSKGWTAQGLVDAGHAEWKELPSAPPPSQQQTAPPPVPEQTSPTLESETDDTGVPF